MPTFSKFLRTYQGLIVSGSLLLFAIIGIAVGVVPSVGKVQELVRQAREISEQNDVLQKKLTSLNALDENTLRMQLTQVLSAVPAERSFPTLFETVEGVAALTGVSILQMSLSGSTTLATPSAAKLSAIDRQLGTRTIPFSVTISGPFASVQQFIALAPNVRRLLRIRTFSISFPKDERPLTVVVEMDAFYEPLPTSLGTAKNVLPTLSAADEEVIQRMTDMRLVSQESGALPPPLIGRVKDDPFSP